ncbi:MAG: alkaline phosphatase family protein [Candidatus Aminicenantes bacterium]|jgi:predicted AlkP superfamily phosphohydrolase/phosphomutase
MTSMKNRKKNQKVWVLFLLILALSLPLQAYVGPGAGFAFLSSFLVLLLTFFLAVFSFLTWPIRFLIRTIKGQKAYKRSLIDKLIILGLDGMEPTLVEKFMSEEKLPNFSKIKKSGAYAKLQTTTPAISPVAWSSFMTGTNPSKHNIFDFLSRDPRTYLPDLSSARIGKPKKILSLGKYNIPLSKPEIKGLRKSIPFWKILGKEGIFSTILRVPITFPPEKFSGHLLSGMCAPDLKGSQGTFFFYTTDKEKVQKREGGVIIPIRITENEIETTISGPENNLLKKEEELRLPLTITIDEDKKGAVLEVSGQRLELKSNTFSEWIKLTFRPGLGMKIRAICRFYISQIHPHFEMYLTPLNIDPEKPALPISYPFIYSVYLAKLQGSFITLGEANDTWALNEGALSEEAFLELTYSNHQEWEDMLFNAIDKTRKGLVTCVFETTDSIQHMFWRYLDKDHPAAQSGPTKMSAQVMEELYVKMDTLVGKALDRLDGKSALIIMSDHGFKSFRRGVNLNSWLYLNGYLSLKEGKKESEEWFKDVDWEKTRVYALGLGGIYLNQKGREAKGVVNPGEETEALKKELLKKLNGLEDNDKDSVAINKVFDRDEFLPGPYKDNCPDLIVGYNEGYRISWDSVTGKVNETIFEDNTKAWSGDHCIDPRLVPGIFFSTQKINTASPSIMDIAPTALTLFGLEIPPHMDGHSLIDTQDDQANQKKKMKGKKK